MSPNWREIAWLADRENGIGFVPMTREYAGHLLLVLGDPEGALEKGHAFLLDAEARAEIRKRFDLFEKNGHVTENWPGDLWGPGPRPVL